MPPAPAVEENGTAPQPNGPLSAGTLNLGPGNVTGAGQALLVSSAPARSATADNVTKLQTITTPPPSTNTTQTTNSSGTGGGGAPSGGNGMYQYKLSNGSTVSIGDPTMNRGMLTGATFVAGPTGKETDPLASAPVVSSGGTAPGGTSSSTNGAGNQYDAAVAGIADKGLAAQFKTSLQTLDTQISQAQSNIDSIKARSLNDPAITGVITSITAKYNQAIQLMKDRNTQLLGKANTSVAAFGGLGVMSQNFLNDQQSRAEMRIQDLQDREDAAIAKAQAAYMAKNDKELNAAMTEYDKVNKDKLDALNNLLTASSKAVAEMQAQQRLDMQQKKDDLAADVTTSTKIAAGVAANIKAAGLTDPSQIDAYIKGIASQYGIQNPDLLASQVTLAQAANDKADLAAANTRDEMNARDKNLQISTDRLALAEEKAANAANNPKVSSSEKKDNFNAGVATLSGTNPKTGKPYSSSDGTAYFYAADDGGTYLTKGGFNTLVQAAKVDGISRYQFISDNANYFDPDKIDDYKLTAREMKLVQQ